MNVTKTSLAYFLENSMRLIHFLNEGRNQCSSEQSVYVSKGGGKKLLQELPFHSPLQCSCLENPMDRGAWLATVHRVAKSRA